MKKITAIISGLALATTFYSCSKSDSSSAADASKFEGTYTMESSCGADSLTVSVSNGGGNTRSTTKISVHIPLPMTTCDDVIATIATVSGNNIQPVTNTFNDACSNVWVVTMSGSLNDGILTLNYSGTANGTPWNCVYSGSKQ
jgi:hypothetical protein